MRVWSCPAHLAPVMEAELAIPAASSLPTPGAGANYSYRILSDFAAQYFEWSDTVDVVVPKQD